MRTIVTSVVTLAMLTVIATDLAAAEGPSSPEARAKVVAPYLDRQTIGVGYVDLRRVDPKALVEQYVRLIPEAAVDQAQMRASLGNVVSALRQHGFPELYVVLSLADVPEKPPILILPIGEKADVAALLKALPLPRSATTSKRDEALIVCSPRTLDRLKGQPPDPRPELVEAFRAAGDTAVQFVVLPTDDHRRMVEEMLPQLPREVGGGASTILTHGLRWMAVGINLPPAVSMRVVVQSQDQTAAAALREKWLAVTRLLGRDEMPQSLRDIEPRAALLIPDLQGDRLILSPEKHAGALEAVLQGFAPPLEHARKRVTREQSMEQLKQIALAMHRYYDKYGSLPAQAKYDAQGKPLLSWRVMVLPFLDQNKLYQQFHLDEPWDSPHNRTLIDKMPDVYRSPASKLQEKGRTNYVYPIGEQTVCPGPRGMKFQEITDGTSNTIMIVEANDDQAVIWTQPDDLPFDPQQPAKGLGALYRGRFNSAWCDGAVHFLSATIDPAVLRILFTRAGGEPFPAEGFR